MLACYTDYGYRLACTLIRGVLPPLAHITVRGIDHMPSDGPAIVVCNHINSLDPVIIMATMPRPVRFMSKIENFRGPLGFAMRLVGIFEVRRGTPDRRAIHAAERTLADGRVLGIFPEGTRSHTSRLAVGHGGAIMLAARTCAPIIPVAITGTPHILRRRLWASRPQVTVTLGTPMQIPSADRFSREQREHLTNAMMQQIAMLLPEELRGYYAMPR